LVVHGLWARGEFHLWGSRRFQPQAVESGGDSNESAQAATENVRVLDAENLRAHVGDLWESLLISGAADRAVELQFPCQPGSIAPFLSKSPHSPVAVEWRSYPVSTLAFSVSDAVDLLSAPVTSPDVQLSDSFRYWQRVAWLALELLAKQRFIPAVDRLAGDQYRGYWRVVVDDAHTSARLRDLIVSMPPVCRAFGHTGQTVQASELVESFLWRAVDGLVRRCLEGDELAHALHAPPAGYEPLQTRWLRSLVSNDPMLAGTPLDLAAIHQAVHGWIGKLQPAPEARPFRTCFLLEPPDSADGPTLTRVMTGLWKLTIRVQATHDPNVVVDADQVVDAAPGEEPRILPRPFAEASEPVRADVARAARYFPPLEPCARADGPTVCELSTEDAYSFLRDAARVLEKEGFVIWTPRWWREDRPRLRMRLDIRAAAGEESPPTGAMSLDALVAYDWRIAIGDEELTSEELAELAAIQEPLVRLRGRWTEVRAADVRQALAFLETNRSGRMTIFEALRQCYVADDLNAGLPISGLRAQGWLERLLNAGGAEQRVEEEPQPEAFRGKLRPYQLRGVNWLSFLARLGLGGCLADDMGLGKTIQLIALWLRERESGRSPGPTLLVVPTSLVGNWQREVERFGSSLRVMVHHGLERLTGQEFIDEVVQYDIVISTYGLVYRDYDHLAAVEWHRVALDEAQNIKNPAAKQSAAIRSLRAVHRLALTGTPVENRLSELWSILDFLNPGYLGAASDFRRRFAVPIERYHDADRAHRLRHLIRPFVLRRLKSDPLIEVDLPEKMEMRVFCNLTKEQAALYEAVVGEMLGQIDRSDGIQRRGLILAALVKLKQVCNHPSQFLSDGGDIRHRSGKCERLVEMVEEVLAEGDRALIFSQFRTMGSLLKKMLEEAFGRELQFLHGGTTRQQRDAMVARFQDPNENTPLFILSLKAGGYGLNLTAANHVFHFDRWWNPAVEDQATDRAHRIGQERRVQVHKFVCVGTLEERIDSMLTQKRALARNVIGSGEDWLTELSTDELRDLFALSKDAVGEE